MRIRYGLLLGIALLGLSPWWASRVHFNFLAIASVKAADQRAQWPALEQAWLQAAFMAPLAEQATDKLCRLYLVWFSAEPAFVSDAPARLMPLSTKPRFWSDTLSTCADIFRVYGHVAVASTFYQAALAANQFSASEAASASRFNLSLLTNQTDGNFVRNGDFADGLRDWTATGQPAPQVINDAVRLGCAHCQLEQRLPVIGTESYYFLECQVCQATRKRPAPGASLYRISFEARSEGGSGSLLLQVYPTTATLWNSKSWSFARHIALNEAWQTVTDWIMDSGDGSRDMRLQLTKIGQPSAWIRHVRVERADALDNRLINASFNAVQSNGEPSNFPGWEPVIFLGQPKARGLIRSVARQRASNALEIVLTDAQAAGEQVGLQQSCGESLTPGTRFELDVDIFIPQDLRGTYAWVGAMLYRPGEPLIHIGLSQKEATAGWVRQTTAGQVPLHGGPYDCLFLLQLIADQSRTGVWDTVGFDNIIFQRVSGN